jgi:signal transduction histidine kinase
MKRKLTIRVRLGLWFTLAVIILLCVFAAVFYFALKPALENQAAGRLLAEATQIAGEVESQPNGKIYMEDSFKSFESPYFSVYDLGGRVIERNHMLGWMDGQPLASGITRIVSHDGDDWMICDFPASEDDKTVAIVRTGEKLSEISEATGQSLLLFLILLPLSCILALPVGLWIAKRALRPIDEITKTASAITKGDLSKRVKGSEVADEVGNLAATFNDMLGTLEGAMERERQFTSDASHELRTPLSVILANAEAGLSQDASSLDKDEALRSIMIKGREATVMLSELLLLARTGRQSMAEFVPVHLVHMAEDIADTLEAKAGEKGIVFHLPKEAYESDPIVLADLHLLTSAVLNLADNAIKYGKDNGNIYFQVNRAGDFWDFVVEDDGIGIESEQLVRIFDRFYQADRAHSTQGAGLGLAIVKRIAELLGGNVQVYSRIGQGSQFHLLLPAFHP